MTPEELYNSIPWLHIYAQYWEHDVARIIGTENALIALRDAIDTALRDENGKAYSKGMTADGEGYSVEIYRVPRQTLYEASLPYYSMRDRKP